MVRWAAVVVLAVVMAAAAGCGGVASPGGPAVTPGPPVWVEATCPPHAGMPVIPDGGSQVRGAIPDDFGTVAVLRCKVEIREEPGNGTWSVLVTERADTDAAELVRALRQPSEPRTAEACTLALVVAPYFLLIDASGRAILPEVPGNACGQPRLELLKPMDSLPWRVVAEQRQGQQRSQKSVESQCPDQYKDMITIGADTARPAPARALWSAPPEEIRICVYDQTTVGGLPAGQLRSGRTVPAGDLRALLDALDQAGPANPGCTASHSRFAVLHSRADSAIVELDGCRRLLRPDNTLAQLDPPTTALIPA